ncbi:MULTISPECIES: cytochrome c maturation protein CcmE [Caballeronia]|jgi:cytochrome c-type biogenesis protein CcmE|uniref:cytochrome c maturation protein CcmE n=1 Tax=Caballeronia TaxID=1827195 RepID=UPI00158D03A9|nr:MULTISPECIES: cytochrome c maturation protein CcmE [Caballeronia]MCG7401850.1 cytochrome c maturation protein CcmE [Caballeronia zhejiangensis]MCI1046094.1 cytochrome c maturation protein CcmE [Caballeronia zhejiangensis]MDR5767916.1 cytochrome c maturation protein CcmE [Caballeronia sp. LZ028]MDR5796514.1 cytochrome c maturation protein CcmE [Caballeronia sp. LZ008]
MKARHRRFAFIALGLASAALACAFVLNAFRANVMFFVSPSEIASHEETRTQRFRLGGLVERGSLLKHADSRTVSFVVTDGRASIPVVYTGALPDLFREGSGVVAQGTLGADGRFHADEVLAKHDEKYTPPPLERALREARASADGNAGARR